MAATTEQTLHIFADASPHAYGAVAYLQQGTQSTIQMSKARTAPLKQQSLPRLELMAAVLGTRLYSFISKSVSADMHVCFWSDSQIYLSWITSKKKLKPFVNNRVNEIRSISISWRYCPSSDNPADLLTRGITFQQLNSSIQWRHGPTWLCLPSEWPIWPQTEILLIQADFDAEVEVPPVETPLAENTELPNIGIQHLIDVTRFSKLS